MSSPTHASTALVEDTIRSFGHVRFRVLGTSMAPSVLPGDFISVQRTDLEEISVGEIVLFSRDGRLFVHRAVSRSSAGEAPCLITRGDRLDHDDPPVSAAEFLGRVTSIQRGRRTFKPAAQLHGWNRSVARILKISHFATRVYSYLFGSHADPVPGQHGIPTLSAKSERPRHTGRRSEAVAEDM